MGRGNLLITNALVREKISTGQDGVAEAPKDLRTPDRNVRIAIPG
jgi:hypothetical protein